MLQNWDENELNYIAQLLIFNTGMVLTKIMGGNLHNPFNSVVPQHPLYSDCNLIFEQLFAQNELCGIPFIVTLNGVEHYICLKTSSIGKSSISFALGPSVTTKITSNIINQLIDQCQGSIGEKEAVQGYLLSLPLHDSSKMIYIAQLFHYLLYKVRLDVNQIAIHNYSDKKAAVNETGIESSMLKERLMGKHHHEYYQEKVFLNLIKGGRLEEIERLHDANQQQQVELPVIAKNNKVRNDKNLAITAVTLACRAAIDGGLDSETAYTLSEIFIQRIESTVDFNDLFGVLKEVSIEYAKRVRTIKQTQYSQPVYKAQEYIHKYLYQKIEMHELANMVNLNPSYLSRLFKLEVGVSISEHILIEKVHESKKWLLHSDLSISEIANHLNFYDQSHFIKVFKRYQKITPKRYRLKTKNNFL
ncbi:AraC family transcriptional regulator [Paenibacillus sp. FSL R10-2199]|uniref:AraC family transcriptional regulator n=1 Tax=Paenibacillus sp. FSL R10-2199 TaxID=2975348 RepID=UPI0030FC71BC